MNSIKDFIDRHVAAIFCWGVATAVAAMVFFGSSSSDHDVKEIVRIDGCTIYRFMDEGRPHYFSNCRGSVSSTYTEIPGKPFTERDEVIATERAQ